MAKLDNILEIDQYIDRFSGNLRYLRKQKGLSINGLSEQIPISKSTINNYENKKTEPSLRHILILCDFFKVDFNIMVRHMIESYKTNDVESMSRSELEYKFLACREVCLCSFYRVVEANKTLIFNSPIF